jgi:hypothetical protein
MATSFNLEESAGGGTLIKDYSSLAYSDPKYDIPILPSDSVTVPRSIF